MKNYSYLALMVMLVAVFSCKNTSEKNTDITETAKVKKSGRGSNS